MENNYNNYTKKIIEVLKDVGVPASLKGYEYLKIAINAVLNDRTYMDQVTKRLYPDVAAMCDTTASRVERSIRHATEVAFNNMDPEQITQYFGRCCNYYKGKATNSEFIAILAERIRVDLGEYDRVSN